MQKIRTFSIIFLMFLFIIISWGSLKATVTVHYSLETPHFLFSYVDNFGSPWGEKYRADVTLDQVKHTQRTLESYMQYLTDRFKLNLKNKIKLNFIFRGMIIESPLTIDIDKKEITMEKADTLTAIEALNDLLSKPKVTNLSPSDLPKPKEALNQIGNDDYDPLWSPDGSKILFKSWKDNMPDLWIKDAKTNSLVRLTEDSGIEMWPQWSPNGTKISYLSDKRLFIMNPDGLAREEVLVKEDKSESNYQLNGVSAYQWSYDEKHITAINYINADYPIDIVIIPIDKTFKPVILRYDNSGWEDKYRNFQWWSPDSKLFAVIGSRRDEIWFFDKSTCLKKVKFWIEESHFNVEGFLWSSDSNKIAVVGFTEKDDRVYRKGEIDKYYLIIVDSKTEKVKVRFEDTKPIELLSWSRDSERLVFFKGKLFTLDINEKEISELSGYSLHDVNWQPNRYNKKWILEECDIVETTPTETQNFFVTYTEDAATEFSPLNLVFPGQWNKFYQTPKRFIWFISNILDKNPKQINSLLNDLKANSFSLHPKHKKIAIVSSKDYSLNRIVIENLQEPCFWEEKFDWDLVKINEFILSSDPAKLSREEFYEYEHRILAGFSGSGGYFLGEEEINWLKNAETVFKTKGIKLNDKYNRYLAYANSYYHMGNYERALAEYKYMNCQWGIEEMEWSINNKGLQDVGVVKIREYSGKPICPASIGAKVQDSRYFFISYFKGAIYRYDKHTKKHAVVFMPFDEYDWANKLEWDGKLLRVHIGGGVDAGVITFNNENNKIEGVSKYYQRYEE